MDVRYALRVLWKSPAFTLVALVTLTLALERMSSFRSSQCGPAAPVGSERLTKSLSAPHRFVTSGKALTTSYPALGTSSSETPPLAISEASMDFVRRDCAGVMP